MRKKAFYIQKNYKSFYKITVYTPYGVWTLLKTDLSVKNPTQKIQ